MKFNIILLAGLAAAFPHLQEHQERQSLPTLPLSQDEHNSGPFESLVFDPQEQFVDVRPGSAHQYVAPGPNDKRGPCPGLNAAANHGFLPHNGITTIPTTVTGLAAAYGFGPEFAAALSAIAVALTGDPTTGTWSIGGKYSPGLLGGLLSNAEGISNSHNAYESDASITRTDAYLGNHNVVTVEIAKFDDLYNRAENYTLDILRDHNKAVHDFSIQNNPYFFQAPFAGLVPPIAHHFVVNLMSNHSADNKNGFLTRDVLKSFFAISGPDNAHVYNAGQERIPLNWYRRPTSNPYGAKEAVADVAILAAKYPDIVSIGGNTGTVNSFVGVNPGDISGGVYTATNLLQGNNLGCFALQAAQQGVPSSLSGVISSVVQAAVALVNEYVTPVTQALNCPALTTFDQSKFNQYPGAGYTPPSVAKRDFKA